MDFAKQYIIQCIVAAANNLRLSSEKIETVAILKERLSDAESLAEEIKNFKKLTELSKLGIKLGEIHASIDNGKIDFLKLSERFKEHSYNIVKELTQTLDVLTPTAARQLFNKDFENPIRVDFTNRPIKNSNYQFEKTIEVSKRTKADEMKEAIILDDLNKEYDFNFENYEETVLKPIKELDSFLNRVLKFDYTENEINGYIKIMNVNGELSKKVGFDVLSNMHLILANGLKLINQKVIAPSINVIESLRACLIVIVAVIKGKEVDITSYLSRAENFGKSISPKQKGT